MNKNIKVSVIIPTYNGSKYIKKAIESVLNQSFKDFEIIVINDGSTDNTEGILREYIEDRKIIYLFQNNSGQASARNKGIEISKGFYIAFIDDDDEWLNIDKLNKQIDFLENNQDYVMVGTNGIIMDESEIKIMDYIVPETNQSIKESILLKNPFILSSVVVRKDILNKVGLFYVEKYVRGNEDYNLWLKVGVLGRLFNLKETMTRYTVRGGNTSSNYKKSILKSNIKFIKEYKNKYPNYKKALLFSYLKFFIYSLLDLIKNKKLKNNISTFLFKKYRKLHFTN